MNKLEGFTKKVSVFMILIIICGFIVPISKIEAKEKKYYLTEISFDNGIMVITDGKNYEKSKKGFLYSDGTLVEPKYSTLNFNREGLSIAESGGKWGGCKWKW